MILSGTGAQSLAAALAAATGDELGVVDRRRFDDGEFVLEVPPALGGDRAVVVAATDSAEAHLELLQLQDAARGAGASEVVTVLSYMGYARQDAAFREGQPVSARAVARAISTGTDRVLVVEPHEPAVLEAFTVPATAVDAAGHLAEPLPADLVDPLFLAPDASATDLATAVRDGYADGGDDPGVGDAAGDVDHLEKHRDRETGEVTVEPADAPVAGRDVVVVDDMVATGGTVSEAVAALRDVGGAAAGDRADGPDRVFVACVHGLLAGGARSRLAAAGVERVVATDTLERPESAVTVAPAVADAL